MTTITLKLNLSKVDKAKLFKGEKGVYLDAVLLESTNNQYSDDFMVVQSVTKEEREAGVKGAIIGNARYNKPKAEAVPQQSVPAVPVQQQQFDNDLPF